MRTLNIVYRLYLCEYVISFQCCSSCPSISSIRTVATIHVNIGSSPDDTVVLYSSFK